MREPRHSCAGLQLLLTRLSERNQAVDESSKRQGMSYLPCVYVGRTNVMSQTGRNGDRSLSGESVSRREAAAAESACNRSQLFPHLQI